LWTVTATVGGISVGLGLIQARNEADSCAAGSHYEYFWLTLGGALVAVALGAWAVARFELFGSTTNRQQLTYIALAAAVVGLAILAWRSGSIDVPFFRDRDFPFGQGVGCAL